MDDTTGGDPWRARLAEFGARLRDLRKRAGLTLESLAPDIASSKSTLSTLERGGGAVVPDRGLVESYVRRCLAAWDVDEVIRAATGEDLLSHHDQLVALHDRVRPEPRRARAGGGEPGGRARVERVVLQGAVLIERPAGDAALDFSRSPFDVERVPGPVPALSVEQARARPSRLLQPRFAVVPFTGRDAEQVALGRWLAEPEHTSVRLLHAAGGQGKTRLADRVAAEHRGGQWAVWQVRHSPAAVDSGNDPEATEGAVPLAPGADVLAVVDYADRWPSDDLITLVRTLQQLARRRGTRARVLLLGRTAKNWWPAVVGRLDTAYGLDATGQWPLASLTEEPAARLSMFRLAAGHFAAQLGVDADPAEVPLPVDLDRDGYAQVLAVQMAALAAVDARHRDVAVPLDLVSVADYLLCREYATWDALYSARGGFTRPPVMSRLAYVATLAGALPRPHARLALRRTDLADSASTADHLIDDHLACYPSADPRTVFEPLHPDRLGEDLVALTTPGHPHAQLNWQVDDWATAATTAGAGTRVVSAAEALTTDLLPDPAMARSWAPAALTVLAEAAHRYPHLSTGLLNPLLLANPHLLLVAGGAAATRLTDLPDLDPAVLEAVEPVLPQTRDVTTDVAAAAVARRLAEHRLATEADPVRRAAVHGDLAMRLDRAGQYEEALANAALAVGEARRATARDPVHRRRLASWLNTLSLQSARAGRRSEALAHAREAVDLRRALGPGTTEPDLPGLANALNSLAKALAELGSHAEALQYAEEAADVLRALVTAGAPTAREALAQVLHNIAASRSDLGADDEALVAAAESVGIYRELAAADPAAHLPDLADALQNLPAYLSSDPGRARDALAAAEESVRLYRELVETNSAPFLAQLAGALHNLSVTCSALGERREAAGYADEAVTTYRDLAETDPDAHQPDLALTLHHQAKTLADNGQRDLAVDVAAEAVTHYRHLAAIDPRPFEPNLAMALYNQASFLSEAGRPQEAVAPAEESVTRYRGVEEVEGDLHAANTADALHNLAFILGEVGRADEALARAEEAWSRLRLLSEEDDSYAAHTAVSCGTVGRLLAGLGRHGEAVELGGLAVAGLRAATAEEPGWEPYLSGALTTLALGLSGLGRATEARTAAREAVDIVRRVGREAPELVTDHMLVAERVLADLTG
ncbi:Tetratricopeptide repeat family [Actinokineospora spheciospongiae]|uniref:Tetratricopeptide repeat family n=1 Tax=Actinokineospora spheciospongiae TaxID=909613 RepID=W7J0D7_9PSEU|nr:tetratricopeptide repeat protein [Actinokineospora spheciospongiae]EWC62386.1 Tetratricopeptide repeat family [Actinokineospora spheciospongiae]